MNKAILAAAAAFATVLGGAGFTAIQGCTVTNGAIDVDGGETSTTPPVNVCNECLYEQCTGQNASCFANSDCAAIYYCAQNPPAGTTATDCLTGHAAAGACLYEQLALCDHLSECNASTCQSQCTAIGANCSMDIPTSDCTGTITPVDDAGLPSDTDGATVDTDGGTVVTTADAGTEDVCSACVDSDCSSQKSACANGTDCDNYNRCVTAATDAAGLATCGTTYPAGQTASQALATCTGSSCATECGS